jgi:hypothetical protein
MEILLLGIRRDWDVTHNSRLIGVCSVGHSITGREKVSALLHGTTVRAEPGKV